MIGWRHMACGSRKAQFSLLVMTAVFSLFYLILARLRFSSSSGILLFQQQVKDSHHLAGGSRRRRTAATVARHLRSSHRWESCLGKIAEVVSRYLPRGLRFYDFYLFILLVAQTEEALAEIQSFH